MKVTWLDSMRGAVTVRIRGKAVERFVNLAAAEGVRLLSLRRTSMGEAECEVTLRDFFRLRPLLRQTGCRLRVLRRHGLPFALAKLERRKFFALGLAFFIVGMYMLSSLVWSVEVRGNAAIPSERVLEAAKREGIYPFQWSFRLKEADVVSKRLMAALPGTAWIGVEKRGTKITIRVVESTVPDARPLMNPRHLVSTNDAVVTRIMAERGRPVVKENTRVKKGDVLISGILGDEQNTETVVAEGVVRGLVWHEYEIVSPLIRKVKTYTGARQVQWYGVAFGRALQVSGYGKTPFAKYETVRREERMIWRGIELPLGRMKQSQLEVRYEERAVSEAEAKAEGLLQARADILAKAGPDAVIVGQNLLHEKADNGKVYMKVLFEVEQSIVEEWPLVHIQGE